MRRSLFIVVTVLLSALGFLSVASAHLSSSGRERVEQSQDERIRQCVETCQAFADQGGYELRRCVADCLSLKFHPANQYAYGLAPFAESHFAAWAAAPTRICETYEEGCDREGNQPWHGPYGPSVGEPSGDTRY